MKQYMNENFKHFLHGGDYSPEQWIDTPEIWDEDMRLMKLANCNEMSVGIFSWAKLEPAEGEYDFSFLDTILDKIYAAGGRVFLATPSGARPHWMADAHPEVLRVNERGQRMHFGVRHNHCYTSPYYREKVAQINEKLSERYGKHPAVLGWHISNEYGGRCYCPLCQEAFRGWLKKKYDNDINKLNFQWWTTFWSHTYNSFDQVEAPSPIGDTFSGLELDWKRFISDQTADFLRAEVAAVRKYSDLPVTTNFMFHYTGLNYNVLAKEIDFISWDSYPEWHHPGELSDAEMAAKHALTHDAFRALKKKPFFLMESAPSHVNWHDINKLKRPGVHRLASLQAVAHGSDSVQYFQWRKSRGSNEKFHGAVVDHLGNENTRVFREVSALGQALKDIEEVLGTVPNPRVALIMDVENKWALDLAQGFQKNEKKYSTTCQQFYNWFWRHAIDIDVIDAHRDLSGYDLVVAPMLYMTPRETIEILEKYVREGGTLIGGYMLGMVNENDLCYLGGFPGEELKEVFGVWNEEIDTLYPTERNAIKCNTCGDEFTVADYCERIHPAEGAEVMAVYRDDFYAGEPAVVKNHYGKGTTYYLATRDIGGEESFKARLLARVCGELGIRSNLVSYTEGVTAHSRIDDENGIRYLFVENYTSKDADVDMGAEAIDVETRERVGGKFTLPAYSVRIFRQMM